MLFNSRRKLLFKKALHGTVDSSREVVAVYRVDVTRILKRHFVSVRVSRLNVVSVNSAQIFIVLMLKSVESDSVAIGKSENMRCERVGRIIASALSLEVNHILKLVFCDKFSYLVRLFLADLSLDGTVEILRVLSRLLVNEIVLDSLNQTRKSLGDEVRIRLALFLLGRCDARRRDEKAVGGYIGRKDVSVAIVYFASVCRY